MSEDKPPVVDEESLILRMMDREESALTEWLKLYGPKVWGFLKRQYGDRLRDPEIDEALNRTAFNLWRFADRFNPERGSLRSWIIRIAQNAAVSILRGESKHLAKDLEYDPSYDPADASWEDDPTEAASKSQCQAEQLDEIIRNHLTGNEQTVAEADLAAGGTADAGRLAALLGTSKNAIYVTRTHYRTKVRRLMQERESRLQNRKGTR